MPNGVPSYFFFTDSRFLLLLLLLLLLLFEMRSQEWFPRGVDPTGQHPRCRGRQFVLRGGPGRSQQSHPQLFPYVDQVHTPLGAVALATARDGILPVQSSPLTPRDDVIEAEFPRVEQVVAVLAAVLVA